MAKILIVDDDFEFAEFLAGHFLEGGHEIAIATKVTEAVQEAQAFQPDMVTVDGCIESDPEDPDGPYLAQRLRDLLGPSAVIVMLSGYDFEFEGLGFNKRNFPEVMLEILALLNRPK